MSSDQSFNCDVKCSCEDKFNIVVNKILEKKPKFIENGFFFL